MWTRDLVLPYRQPSPEGICVCPSRCPEGDSLSSSSAQRSFFGWPLDRAWPAGRPAAPGPQRAEWVSPCLVLRDRGVAVPMVDLDVALAVEVCLEDIAVAMVPPPGAQLSVPGAVQHVEELGMLHANHGEEVLVPKVAPEAVLVCKLLNPRGLQQMAVERGLAHSLQVQQHHSTVEAREPLRGRVPNSGPGVLMAELPECVPMEGKKETIIIPVWGE